MTALGYEIKYSKNIAFNHKDKQKFTRAKTIGEDYSEESIKERISEITNQKTLTIKNRIVKCQFPSSCLRNLKKKEYPYTRVFFVKI